MGFGCTSILEHIPNTMNNKKIPKGISFVIARGLINQVLLAYKEDIGEKLQRRIYEE